MNRTLVLLMGCLATAGCGTHTLPGSSAPGEGGHSVNTRPAADAEAEYEAVPASALVFSPPLAPPGLGPALARAGRDVSAFVGYEEVTTEYFYLRVDDRQSDHYRDNYERRAVSEKVGVRYR